MGAEFTAKDFRTWGATLQAIEIMARTPLPESTSESALNACIVAAVKQVAAQLRNTPAVCRKSYINPIVFAGWRSGALHKIIPPDASTARSKSEQMALAFLRRMARASRGNLCRSDPESGCGAGGRATCPEGPAFRHGAAWGSGLGACRTGNCCSGSAGEGAPRFRMRLRSRPEFDAHPHVPTRCHVARRPSAVGARRVFVAASKRRACACVRTARWPRRRTGAPRLGAHASQRHHRLQRVAARAHYRRACQRGRLPRRADRDPPGRLSRDRRRVALVREHAVQSARGRRHPDRPLRHAPMSAAPRASTAWDFRIATAGACRRSPASTTTSRCPATVPTRRTSR